VEHSCAKCGSIVEDGRPFCPQCRAPQVRVQVAGPPEQAGVAPLLDSRTTPDPLERLAYGLPVGSRLFRVALQAGLLGVIANLIPLGLGMVLTGILAALLYHRAFGQRLPAAKAGRLGAMAGAIAFAVSSLLTVLAIVVFHAQDQFRDFLMKAIDQRAASSPPEAQAVLQWMHTPNGFATVLALSTVFALALSVLLAAIGCMVGAVLFRERNRPPF